VQVAFGAGDWRQSPETAEAMFAVFPVMRQLKELLWYLAEALTLLSHGALRDEVQRAQEQTERVQVRATDRQGADLIGAKLRGSDLHGASLRGAYLIGADLRGADLQQTDLLGADLRGADLRGARLSSSLFLTQPQLDAATGDASTTIPASLARPRHWSSTVTSTSVTKSRPRRDRR